MALIESDAILKREVITRDAYILGEVSDIRYDIKTWDIIGLSIKANSESAGLINVTLKTKLLLATGDYAINHVVLLDGDINSARSKISLDSDSNFSVTKLKGLKMYTSDDRLVGEVEAVNVDVSSWIVSSFIVKVDKNAYQELEVKKGLFGKKIGGIMTSHVSTVAEDKIILSITMDEVKNNIIVL